MPPVANAGADWSGPIAHIDHAHVTLDGRGSFDPDPGGFHRELSSGIRLTDGTLLSQPEVDSIQFTLGITPSG